jgi:hypothetical protein
MIHCELEFAGKTIDVEHAIVWNLCITRSRGGGLTKVSESLQWEVETGVGCRQVYSRWAKTQNLKVAGGEGGGKTSDSSVVFQLKGLTIEYGFDRIC